MNRATHRISTDSSTASRKAVRESAGSRVLEFPVGRKAHRPTSGATAPRAAQREPRQPPRDRFLRAIEMERRGFTEGAIAHLRMLYEEVSAEADPCLAISIRYFLASFLMLRGETVEARSLAEDGILLAWEHGAAEEMELLESLSQQLGG